MSGVCMLVCLGVGVVEREAHPILWKYWNSRRSDSQLNKHQSSSTLPPPTPLSRTPCTSYSTLIPHSDREREWETERKRNLYCHHCLSVIAIGLEGRDTRPKSRVRASSLWICSVPYMSGGGGALQVPASLWGKFGGDPCHLLDTCKAGENNGAQPLIFYMIDMTEHSKKCSPCEMIINTFYCLLHLNIMSKTNMYFITHPNPD